MDIILIKITNVKKIQTIAKLSMKREFVLNVKKDINSIQRTTASSLSQILMIVTIVLLTGMSVEEENGIQHGFQNAIESVNNVKLDLSSMAITNVFNYHQTVLQVIKTVIVSNVLININ